MFFYEPVSRCISNKLPATLSPNFVTSIALMHALIPLVVMWAVYGASTLGDVDRWFIFLEAWCYFMYRLVDEVDGKLARKHGNDSALG